jgi:hypothetical protein
MRMSGLAATGALPRRVTPQLVWILLAALLVAIVIAGVYVGAAMRNETLRSDLLPPSSGVENGWIAFSTQPGFVQIESTDWSAGGDIYLVRQGVEPKMIVSRGAEMAANVCPAFSPDGSKLVYGTRAGSDRALVFLSVATDGSVIETARLGAPGEGDAPCPRWSTDGQRVLYVDRPLGARFDFRTGVIVVRGLDGSTLVPAPGDPGRQDLLDDGGGAWPIVGGSPDGRYLLSMEDVYRAFTMTARAIRPPPETIVLASRIPVNGARSWPRQGDVSWQPVYR